MDSKQAVFEVLGAYVPGDRFSSYDLYYKVKIKTGEIHHIGTYLRYLREYRRKTGRIIRNANKAKSIYEVMT